NGGCYAIFLLKFPFFSLAKADVASDLSWVTLYSGKNVEWLMRVLIFNLQSHIEWRHCSVVTNTNSFVSLRIIRPHSNGVGYCGEANYTCLRSRRFPNMKQSLHSPFEG